MKHIKDDAELYFEERAKREPEFKKACAELEEEEKMIRSMIDARNAADMTQEELSKATGIDQGSLSRIENGEGNPTINKLKKIAKGMNAKLKIEFIPLGKEEQNA